MSTHPSALVADPSPENTSPHGGSAVAAPLVLDNRPSYLAFSLAWLVGHGSFAVSQGQAAYLSLPSWAPITVLLAGLLAAIVVTSVAASRAQRGADRAQAQAGNLLAISWIVGFGALFLTITALAQILDEPHVHTVLWPTAAGLIVGVLYLGAGAVHRDLLHYALGVWLALTSTSAIFLDVPQLYWMLALAGGAGYALAALIEPYRRAAALAR